MRVLAAFIIVGQSAPAIAASTAVTEPSGLLLFALGVLGVIVGRQTSRRKGD